MRVPLVLAGAVLSQVALADVRLPSVFSDGMVLQREAVIPVWGFARPGEKVTVMGSWPGAGAVTATADGSGLWDVRVQTSAAGGPYTLKATGETTVVVSDVMIGEVWLASGQSNMEMPLSQADGGADAAKAADLPAIRFFQVPNTTSLHPRLDTNASWQACTPASAPRFSAAAFHFARILNGELNVPIGIIQADWGGTRIEAWMSDRSLRAFDRYNDDLRRLASWKDPTLRPKAGKQAWDAWYASLDTLGPAPVGGAWASADFDDHAWNTMPVPARWAKDGLDRFDGVVYHRTTFTIPPEQAGTPATLSLGPIDDRDDTFINGTPVGSTRSDNQWSVPRMYEVPGGVLRAGTNTLAVRVIDDAGPGGIFGEPSQLTLTPEGGSPIALAGEWRYRRGVSRDAFPRPPQPVEVNANTITALYHGMISPVARFGLRGFLWYQGESNIGDAAAYRALFPAMIDDWRLLWGQGDLPFLFVQIAPYGYANDRGAVAELREAQLATLRAKSTGMVVTLDIGDPADIHPRNKAEVGRRLALQALAIAYGRDAECSGPIFRGFGEDAGTIRVTFDHASGLTIRDPAPGLFHVAGADKAFFPADARVEDDSLVLSSPKVPAPVAARYAWDRAPRAALFNAAGLPASPFRTDEWAIGEWTIDEESYLEPLRSRESGFVDLIMPGSLKGWIPVNVPDDTFVPSRDEKGRPAIHCSGQPTGVLRTDRMYENYVLELEWRHLQSGGNSGLFVHADALTAPGVPFSRAVEVQVMDGLEGSGYTSDGDVFPIHGSTMRPENPRGNSPRAFPTERRMNPAPRWNHYRVESRNGDLTLAVNGKVVTRGHDASPRKGYICLESEGSPIDFRNIRIRELPPSGSLAPGQVASADEGFVPLFNSRDLAGWKAEREHEGHWTVDDGVIRFDGQGTHLWTSRSYKDFVLVCDWRFVRPATPMDRPTFTPAGEEAKGPDGKTLTARVPDAGDSGIYLRGNEKSQVNIWCWPCGSGEVWGYRTDPSTPADVRAACTPRERADRPPGEWNRFVITMKGETLNVVLNGRKVIEEARLPGVPREGPIALQKHGDPIEFMNIFIKELE